MSKCRAVSGCVGTGTSVGVSGQGSSLVLTGVAAVAQGEGGVVGRVMVSDTLRCAAVAFDSHSTPEPLTDALGSIGRV